MAPPTISGHTSGVMVSLVILGVHFGTLFCTFCTLLDQNRKCGRQTTFARYHFWGLRYPGLVRYPDLDHLGPLLVPIWRGGVEVCGTMYPWYPFAPGPGPVHGMHHTMLCNMVSIPLKQGGSKQGSNRVSRSPKPWISRILVL